MRRHLLIVEDIDATFEDLVPHLDREGFTCTRARDFREAVALSHSIDFACIVLDLGLNDTGGDRETASRIPELRGQVVVYTGSGDPHLGKIVRQTGAALAYKLGGLENLLSLINQQTAYTDEDTTSGEAILKAQYRMGKQETDARQQPLESTTKVSLSLAQMVWLVGAIVTCTVAILGAHSMLKSDIKDIAISQTKFEGKSDVSNKDIIRQLTEIQGLLQKNTDADTERDRALQARLNDWNPWRWSVTIDLVRLGEVTNTPITTQKKTN